MRKDVAPDVQMFRRLANPVKIALSSSIYENAACLATLTPVPQNGKIISEGMAQCAR